MKTICVNVFSDGDGHMGGSSLQFTLLATHKNPRQVFADDWYGCLEQVKQEHPNEWQVADVEKIMRRLGWKLKSIKTVEVEY
jgi:hypothetical protein